MGTGSFGGGGGGGGGRGGISDGIGGYRFKDGKYILVAVAPGDVRRRISQTLSRLSKDYVDKQFGSPLIRSVYEELFTIARCVYSESPSEALAAEYGIIDAPGFVYDVVNAVMEKYQQFESDQKVRETARMCVEDFLVRALGNDSQALDLYLNGTLTQVLARLDQKAFRSTSGYFLGFMIWRVLEREYERQPPEVQVQIRQESQVLADRIISSFEQKFLRNGEAHYRDLFRIAQENPDWFRRELRNEF